MRDRERERESGNWLTWLWWAGRPEIQVRTDVAVLNLKSSGRGNKSETEAGILCCNLEAELLLLLETLVFTLKVLNWLDEAH